MNIMQSTEMLQLLIRIRILPDSSKSFHSFLGLKCAGPSQPVNYIVTTLCPTNATLNYDTARVAVRNDPTGKTTLSRRCLKCEAQYAFFHGLEKHGLLAEVGVVICVKENCFKPTFHASRPCKDHLSSWVIPLATENPDQLLELGASLSPALALAWVAEQPMRNMLDLC